LICRQFFSHHGRRSTSLTEKHTAVLRVFAVHRMSGILHHVVLVRLQQLFHFVHGRVVFHVQRTADPALLLSRSNHPFDFFHFLACPGNCRQVIAAIIYHHWSTRV